MTFFGRQRYKFFYLCTTILWKENEKTFSSSKKLRKEAAHIIVASSGDMGHLSCAHTRHSPLASEDDRQVDSSRDVLRARDDHFSGVWAEEKKG